jgi:hypothetical protein
MLEMIAREKGKTLAEFSIKRIGAGTDSKSENRELWRIY